MGQNGNGIINTNINQAMGYGSNISVGANSNYGAGASGAVSETDKSSAAEVGFDYVGGSKKTDTASSVMENFQEYMRDKQEKAKEAGEDMASKEKAAKEQAKEVSRSISSEEQRQLEMMGIDVETANMTDLMGMVNTLRYNAESQETAELMAKIAVDKGEVGSMTMIGGRVTVGGTELSGVSVSDVLVADSEAAQEKNPVTDSVQADTFTSEQSIKLSDNEAVYLLKNNMELTKANVYKAHYSGVKLAEGVSDKVLADMESQLNKVIEQAGLAVEEETMEATKLLVNNDIPLTTDNLRKYMDMKQLMGKTCDEAGIPEKAIAVSNEELDSKAAKLYEDIRSIDPKLLYDMVAKGKTATIAAAVKYSKTTGTVDDNVLSSKTETEPSQPMFTDAKAVTAMRQMEEIRLSMTTAMAGKLIKMDMNVDTRELSKVVSMLKDIENQMAKDAFYAVGVAPTEENVSLYQEVSAKVNAIGKAPEGVVAAPLMGEAFTIEGLHRRIEPTMAMQDGAMEGQTGEGAGAESTAVSGSYMETVRRSYEAVGTAPRRDMGDSITKAFANVQDILQEMDMPVNYETERAVRILGYNQLQITEENINQIIDYDRQVNDMLNTFYPEAVIGMIKDGINPLDVPIDELNKKIRDKNYNQGVTEAKNFATYLRDMEKQGELTPAERDAYVGMYRVMEKLSKSGDREAGYLFANGSRLTVRNLITAMRSRKAAGVDVGIDDGFGMLQDMTVKGKRMDEQIEGAFAGGTEGIQLEDQTLSLSETMELLTDNVERFMEENSIDITAVNVQAVSIMLNNSGSVYSLVSELLGKMKFNTNTKAEMIDEEAENMADSMVGEDVPVDIADLTKELALDSILEQLRGSEEMSLKYDDLRANLTELMYQWGAAGTLTQMDIATIKTVSAGFNIMSNMAKEDKFQIPVDTDQGTKVMNLTIKKHGENPGLVQVSMNTEAYGEISVAVKCDEKGALTGQMVSDTSEGNLALRSSEDSFKSALAEAGYNAEAVAVGTVSQTNLMAVNGITSEKLYQVSVAVVKAVSVIM